MKTTISQAVSYYTALGKKNLVEVKKYLHSDVEFVDRKEKVIGREALLNAPEGFSRIFKSLTIHLTFSSEEQAAIVYEVEIPGLSKNLHAASLLSFREGLILEYSTKR